MGVGMCCEIALLNSNNRPCSATCDALAFSIDNPAASLHSWHVLSPTILVGTGAPYGIK